MGPLVSVIIPTYNRKEFLKKAITSVESQTYKNLEIVIADDGSTDSTGKYLETIPYKTIHLKHTGKPGYVRNRGFLASEGEYIAFLDSDDIWIPDKVKLQIDFFVHNPTIQICHTRETWIRNSKTISQKKQNHKRNGFIFNDALKKCIIGPSTVMLRRKLFIASGMFHPGLEIAEDYELWLRITARHCVGYIDNPLVTKYGGHPDQLSKKYGHIEYFRIQALEEIIKNRVLAAGKHKKALLEIIHKYKIFIQGCKKRGKTREAERYTHRMEKYKKKLENYPILDNYL